MENLQKRKRLLDEMEECLQKYKQLQEQWDAEENDATPEEKQDLVPTPRNHLHENYQRRKVKAQEAYNKLDPAVYTATMFCTDPSSPVYGYRMMTVNHRERAGIVNRGNNQYSVLGDEALYSYEEAYAKLEKAPRDIRKRIRKDTTLMFKAARCKADELDAERLLQVPSNWKK